MEGRVANREGLFEPVVSFFLGKDRLNRKDAMWGYIFSLPWLIGFLLLTIGPIVVSSIMSFHEWHGFGAARFVGSYNYRWIVQHDRLFKKSLQVTSTFVGLSVPLKTIAAFVVALLLAKRIFGVTVFRSMYYLPSVVTGVAMAFMWMYILDPKGPLNMLLQSIFHMKQPIGWLADPDFVVPSFVIMNVWQLGAPMIILLAGIKGIPASLYESALIDGASSWQRMWKITLPMLSPSLFYVFVIGIIGAFQILTAPIVIFGTDSGDSGGPLGSGLFYTFYLYRKAFVEGRMGYACALAWILFVIIAFLTLFNFFVLGKRVYYEE